ncbi:hypothetical protein NC652_040080 [Populus alba x Populus x berolinensis]|nr:hypothetical protein NC652_040080 [Populus alba x Populus x berolinensis]
MRGSTIIHHHHLISQPLSFSKEMGSNSSRPGSRASRTRPNSRSSRFFSSLICGGSSSSRTARHEIWERLRGGLDENGRRTTSCPSGLHPDGTCSCESFLMAEESSARGSISRIVMLAEALFEVLDEIHRQPVSLSLSMMSLPAPESVVDSFPLKNHKKLDRVKGNDEDEQ